MLTPEQLIAFDAWAVTDGCAEGGMNMEEFHYWHSCFAAGIAQGRAEQRAADAKLCRLKSIPHTRASENADLYAIQEHWGNVLARDIESSATPYPQFCRTPTECAGRTSCPRQPACSE